MNALPISMATSPPLPVVALLVLLLAALTPPARAQEAPLVGTWSGALELAQGSLRLVFHIQHEGDGYVATMDSPDQGATGIPVSDVAVEGDSIRLDVATIGGAFEGRVGEEGQRIEGHWLQAGQRLPLAVEKQDERPGAPRPDRPQLPEAPFPYETEEVRFVSDTLTLGGTLTLPEGEGPFRAVVLITGSGPQDRDETIAGHKPFLVLADYLTRQGIAVLRYDERGVGVSEGAFEKATLHEFADDAEAAHSWLTGHPRIDAGEVGLVGHSEGGTVAAYVAARNDAVAFLVLLASPGLPGRDVVIAQAELLAQAMGAPPPAIETQRLRQERLLNVVMNEPDEERAADSLRAIIEEGLAGLSPEMRAAQGVTDEVIEAQIAMMTSPWYRVFIEHDPRVSLREVTVPVLALNGEKDLQVPAGQNLEAIRQALDVADNDDVRTVALPALNHLFQTAETGLPREYNVIAETFAPAALSLIAEWILEVTTP